MLTEEESHREPCARCHRWQWPAARIESTDEVLYRCRCGYEWEQGRDTVNHACDWECRYRCRAPLTAGRLSAPPRMRLSGGTCPCGSGVWIRRCGCGRNRV